MKLSPPKLNIRKYIPNIKITKPRFPAIHAPKIRLPNIGRITARQLLKVRTLLRAGLSKLRAIRLPILSLPKPRMPKISLPKLSAPKIKAPNIIFPQISLPKLDWKPNVKSDTAAIACLSVLALLLIVFANGLPFWPSSADASQFSALKPNVFMTAQAQKIHKASYLNEISPAAGGNITDEQISPPADDSLGDGYKYSIDEEILEVEAVLIPNATTVISSSRDSKIKSINFDNGQIFKKGDTLVEYTCDDARAEVEIAKTQEKLTNQKKNASYKLFKLDIISNIERLELEAEDEQAEARTALHKSRMKDCFIRAEYDGRVVKRLANAGEFTRTDRVLMEVASLDTLKAEFLLPSRALRWINIGAPIDITINETDEQYPAKISHIYGEVDPISQSIQVTAQLEKYETPLLPGMSGTTTLDLTTIRNAGITGFLETKPAQ